MTPPCPGADQQPSEFAHIRAIIVGAGFSGLGMAIALQQHGVDYIVLEEADDIGGAWRDNTYPGCGCDTPSHLYSFSFAPKPDWQHMFSYQAEILSYMRDVVEKYELRRHIFFNSSVTRCLWDADEYRWQVITTDGREFRAQFLILGTGALHLPSLPNIDGRQRFKGPAFHSARWNHDVDLTGKRVAVIGTGASATQIVPDIIDRVAELHLYQHTPQWVLPRSNHRLPPVMRWALTKLPGLRALLRINLYWAQETLAFGMLKQPLALRFIQLYAKANIRRSVPDPQLRHKLTPQYRLGCKRILYSSTYFGAVADPKTELITNPIIQMTSDGIITADNTHRHVDVVLYCTGFIGTHSYTYNHLPPDKRLQICGEDGEDLTDRWNKEGVSAHRGITVAGLPNLFMLLGPNTGQDQNSVVFMIESQTRYITNAIATCDRLGAQALAPTSTAQNDFNKTVQRELTGAVFDSADCRGWYVDEHGNNSVILSRYTWQYRLATRSVKPSEYYFAGTEH